MQHHAKTLHAIKSNTSVKDVNKMATQRARLSSGHGNPTHTKMCSALERKLSEVSVWSSTGTGRLFQALEVATGRAHLPKVDVEWIRQWVLKLEEQRQEGETDFITIVTK